MPYLDDTDLGAAYELTRERDKYPRGDFMHGVLGPGEHKAFVREATALNPLTGFATVVGAPAYSAAKTLGLTKARSPASLDEIFAAVEGFGLGLKDRAKQRKEKK